MADNLKIEVSTGGAPSAGGAVRGAVTVTCPAALGGREVRLALVQSIIGSGQVVRSREVANACLHTGSLPAGLSNHPFEFALPAAGHSHAGRLFELRCELVASVETWWASALAIERSGASGFLALLVMVPALGLDFVGAGWLIDTVRAKGVVTNRTVLAVSPGTPASVAPVPEDGQLRAGGFAAGVLFGVVAAGFAMAQMWPIALVALAFALAATWFLALAPLVVASRLGEIALDVPTAPLRAEEVLPITLRMTPRAPISGCRARATLTCTERAALGGPRTPQRSLVTVVAEHVLTSDPGSTLAAGVPVQWRGELVLPPGALPSLEVWSGAVVWTLAVRVEAEGVPPWTSERVLAVAAAEAPLTPASPADR